MNSVLNLLYPPSTDLNTNSTNANAKPLQLLDIDMDISLRYIATIYDMILSVPDTLLVSSLAMVCHSISRWLEDKSEVIPDQIHFKHMLFIAPLDGPESCAGGVFHYFEDFWLTTYHKRPEFIPQYEPELKMVLKGLGKVDDRGFVAGLTQSDDLQGAVSVVPETQSLEPVPITGSQAILQYCDAFAAAQQE
ncbi:hypothetical protein BT96DRAFT_999185 [Gymnopus androsaceus JB14]|uniref:Uncharacterized protein n=1 Tax=Gymnopus androsaceus JB14 TaxID=1447944 RepID=A0A6A4H994_9AGAR|nr:hypothetical protein BT96DRAFT_999185 [Gymnopus androsaceus JB14]